MISIRLFHKLRYSSSTFLNLQFAGSMAPRATADHFLIPQTCTMRKKAWFSSLTRNGVELLIVVVVNVVSEQFLQEVFVLVQDFDIHSRAQQVHV